jgi:hypothetical protein
MKALGDRASSIDSSLLRHERQFARHVSRSHIYHHVLHPSAATLRFAEFRTDLARTPNLIECIGAT